MTHTAVLSWILPVLFSLSKVMLPLPLSLSSVPPSITVTLFIIFKLFPFTLSPTLYALIGYFEFICEMHNLLFLELPARSSLQLGGSPWDSQLSDAPNPPQLLSSCPG